MKQFLSDYGLDWKGDKKTKGEFKADAVAADLERKEPTYRFQVKDGGQELDLDRIMGAVELVNEKVTARVNQRKLIQIDQIRQVPLRFFANGIQIQRNAFHPYISKECHDFFNDVIDGFMPAYLKHQHPEGCVL